LQQAARGRRWTLTPQAVHQPVRGHHTVCVEQQHRQQRTLLRSSYPKPLTLVVIRFQRTKNGETHTRAPSRDRHVPEAKGIHAGVGG
jgi:hypothetical protein